MIALHGHVYSLTNERSINKKYQKNLNSKGFKCSGINLRWYERETKVQVDI